MKRNAVTAALLAGGFLIVAGYFSGVDFYHRHFFDAGIDVCVYNAFRVAFAGYLVWIIGFVGRATLAALPARESLGRLRPLERAVVAFGVGLGVVHVGLLALGIAGLYFRWFIIVLCVVALIASAPYFNRSFERLRAAARAPHPSRIAIAGGILIAVAAAWLLIAKGLYPGGSGDYFTHYFYYYLEVLANHDLAPNDVWYHYYYSKGAGPTFLGMLVTDPEAPEIVTFCYVLMAGIALATLCARIVRNSLWPAFCAGLYYVSYIAPMGSLLEFQKAHEETTAIIILITWSLCMHVIGPPEWRRALFVMTAALLAAAAILELPAAVIFGAILGAAAVVAAIRRHYTDARLFGLLCAIAAGATFAILALNVAVTGLATDRALDVALRFANLEKLYAWGVIPQIIMVEWLRDNAAAMSPQPGTKLFAEWASFLRIDLLWPLLVTDIVAVLIAERRRTSGAAGDPSLTAQRLALFLGGLIVALALISIPAAGSQTASYLRFSWFFFPLILLFSVACYGMLAASFTSKPSLVAVALPALLFSAMIFFWQFDNQWLQRANRATMNASRFLSGADALSTAYNESVGVNPVALSAFHAAPPGARIWSTNVGDWCVVPGCVIESVVSFKMSSRLNEILNGSPDRARDILREEKLNYFIVSPEVPPIDALPYSRLFAPAAIGTYLGIQWSDGLNYLLTWRGPGVQPLTPDFMRQYTAWLDANEDPWFRFRELIPNMKSTMATLESSGHPFRTLRFSWRENPALFRTLARKPGQPTATAAAPSKYDSNAAPVISSATLAGANVDIFDALDTGRGRRDGMKLSPNQAVLLSGWTFDPVTASPGRGVEIVVDGKRAFPARYGLPRSDVAAALKNVSLTNTGFEAIVPASEIGLGKHTLVVVVVGENGSTYSSGPNGTLHLTVALPKPVRFERR